jgi:DNA modification methylase
MKQETKLLVLMNNIELNKIYCESNLDTMANMPDNFIDLVITSPPYDNLRDYKGYSFDFESIAKELYRVIKEGGIVVWIVGDSTIDGSESGTSFKQALYFKECGFNLHDTMIYNRVSPFPDSTRYHQSFEYMFVLSKGKPKTFNGLRENKSKKSFTSKNTTTYRNKDGTTKKLNKKAQERLKKSLNDKTKLMSNIWKISAGFGVSTVDKVAFNHPAIFPEKLAANHIVSWSNENDLVYDPFMGSGTTAKMAHIYKRNWIGSDLSKEYVDIANKRLKPYLTQTTLF